MIARPALAALIVALAPAIARADDARSASTATCDADLVAVEASFDETLARLEKASTAPHDELCAAVRHHIEVMLSAAAVFDRCLADGHDKRENMGQALATADDFRAVLLDEGCPPLPAADQ